MMICKRVYTAGCGKVAVMIAGASASTYSVDKIGGLALCLLRTSVSKITLPMKWSTNGMGMIRFIWATRNMRILDDRHKLPTLLESG